MTTMAQAIRTYVQSAGGKVTADQIKHHINAECPGQWKASTLQAHLYACVVNNPKAYIHHPFTERFLYRNADGTFELYSEPVHGPNEWVLGVNYLGRSASIILAGVTGSPCVDVSLLLECARKTA